MRILRNLKKPMLDPTGENILARFSDLENNPHETISPYLLFNVEGKLYYFTPGGFLYCRDPATEEVGGIFCGYLTEEVWRYRTCQEEEAEEEGVEGPPQEQRSWWRRWFGV
jgi:hypothetical protein